MKKDVVLVIGANGQLGSVLVQELQKKFGEENIISSDLYAKQEYKGVFEVLDATDIKQIQSVVVKYKVTQIYHLAAILSAKGEEQPLTTWDINMQTLFNVLEVARYTGLDKVFFPSSIAVFGEGAPADHTPNNAYCNPTTVYGISKAVGENWAQYYCMKYGLDVRSVRYPGIIGYQSLPGGGTTDYAVDIFHKAVRNEEFCCFLKKDTTLPMMFIDDAVRATLTLMDAPRQNISIRTSYNIAGVSFSPLEVTREIRKLLPDFKIKYQPDYRQDIAITWPKSIDDTVAKNDWRWIPSYTLKDITKIMIRELTSYYHIESSNLDTLVV